METPRVFESEYRFCRILWEHEPVKSGELVQLCREQLGWKPTTTYTVIKRLTERGVVKTGPFAGEPGRGAGRRDRCGGGKNL